jgi:hypothetical protein
MIIVQILGGLGNQMFQYAAGRALAEKLHQPLRLDVSKFDNYRLHNGFQLSRTFVGTMELAAPEDLQRVLGWRVIPPLKRLLLWPEFSMLRGNRFVVEPHFQYWAEINQVPPNTFLIGYWQTEKYFKSIEPNIRADFVFGQPMSQKNRQIADEITQSNAISLHVRRGDYVQNTKTFATHGVCSLDYYRAAIQHIAERVDEPNFFVFSDDIAWVKDNLKIDFPYQYVDHNNGAESYNDMRLMSLCQHHIIANSSFSWWGAWLNSNHNKMVIAPKKWFANNNNFVTDLYPQGWITL